MDDIVRKKTGPEEEVQKQQAQGQGKIPSIILKGVVVALAVALLPLLQKQSNMSSYANHATVARSWELINLVVVGLAVSYGLMARRAKDSNDEGQGTHNYVQKMFEFAGVFDDGKVETWSSRYQPEEPLIVIADSKKDMGDKPLLLPVRSLKSTLSNPDVFNFLNDANLADLQPVQNGKTEVRNGELLSVESGNFEEEVDHLISVNGEPAVFPSPIPWASRRDVMGGGAQEPHQPAETLAPIDGKVDEPRAIPSPIPWHSRPDQTSSIDGKQKNSWENPNVSEGKPPLAPPQRHPPSPSPRPSPSPSPPRPRSAGLANGASLKNPQTPPTPPTPPQKLSSPSPPCPRNAAVDNGSSEKQNNPTKTTAKETPPPPPPPPPSPTPTPMPAVTQNGLHAMNGSSRNNHANGDVSRPRERKDVPISASSDEEVKPRKAPIPSSPLSTPPLSPATSSVFEELSAPRKASENGVANRSDSRSKGREGSSHRSDSRSKSRDASSHSQHSNREVDIDNQKSKDAHMPPRMQSERSSRKFPSPSPPPVYADVPSSNPLPPPPPPPPLYPDEPTSDPITPPPSVWKDEEHAASFRDDLKHEAKRSSSPKVVFEVGDYDSGTESEVDLDDGEDQFEAAPDEVDKKAAQFIAKFHEQIRLQRQASIRRSQKQGHSHT